MVLRDFQDFDICDDLRCDDLQDFSCYSRIFIPLQTFHENWNLWNFSCELNFIMTPEVCYDFRDISIFENTEWFMTSKFFHDIRDCLVCWDFSWPPRIFQYKFYRLLRFWKPPRFDIRDCLWPSIFFLYSKMLMSLENFNDLLNFSWH